MVWLPSRRPPATSSTKYTITNLPSITPLPLIHLYICISTIAITHVVSTCTCIHVHGHTCTCTYMYSIYNVLYVSDSYCYFTHVRWGKVTTAFLFVFGVLVYMYMYICTRRCVSGTFCCWCTCSTRLCCV